MHDVLVAQVLLLLTTIAGFVYQYLKQANEAKATRLALRERDEASAAAIRESEAAARERETRLHEWDVQDRALIASNLQAKVKETAAQLAEDTARRTLALQEELRHNTDLTKQAVVEAKTAYREANALNLKIAAASIGEAEKQAIVKTAEVSLDTNERVRNLEAVVIDPDPQKDAT